MRLTEEQYQDFLNRGGTVAHDPVKAAAPAVVHAAPAIVRTTGQSARGMNGTESAYAADLELQLRAGQILWYDFERFKLRLAPATFYTPDFSVLTLASRLEFHETKGFWRDDARVKIKVAAERFPFVFVAISKRLKRDGGGWHREYFNRKDFG